MAAANTDLFKKLSRRWVGQIGAGGVSDASVTTIPLSSTTNLPTGTAVVVVIDRVNANGVTTASLEETVIGVVSGSNLVNCVRGAEGTAQAHNAGAVVEVLVTAKGWNDLVDGLIVEHNQLGGHTNITASNISSSAVITACSIDFNAAGAASGMIRDANDNELLKFTQTTSAVNELIIGNAATGSAVTMSVTGGDTNINLARSPKGSGVLVDNGPVNYAADAGANDTYAITVVGITAYSTGQVFRFKANTINTGAATLNVNGLGAITIVKNYNVTLADGDIKANQIVEVIYDGTNFQLLSPISNTAAGGITSKAFSWSRDLSLASGNVSYTGVGFTPTAGVLFGSLTGTNLFVGAVDSAKGGRAVNQVTGSTSDGFIIGTTSGAYQYGDISTYDADGFTLAYTKTGSPTGTANMAGLFMK